MNALTAATVTISPWLLVMLPLIGTLVGVLGASITTWISGQAANERLRYRLAVEIAMKEWDVHIAWAKASSSKQVLSPLSAYLQFHVRLQKLIHEGRLDAKTVEELNREADKLREWQIGRQANRRSDAEDK